MCVTGVLNIVYIVVLVGGTVLACVSTFTDEWRKVELEGSATGKTSESMGLLKSGLNVQDSLDTLDGWDKISFCLMLAGIVSCIAALVWSMIVCNVCCCRKCLIPPLIIFSALAAVCLAGGVAIFALKSQDTLTGIPPAAQDIKSSNATGFSLWVGAIAVVVMVVDTGIAVVLTKITNVAPPGV